MRTTLCLAAAALLTAAVLLTASTLVAAPQPPAPPDLTQSPKIDRELTYNLGATGLRGWIFSKPLTHFDGLQGRTTALSRQILVTHVGKGSPADGVMEVDDVILGVNGKPFADDARKAIAAAIQEAEKESSGGALKLLRWRAGKTENVQLKLRVLGTYSATAPYDCPKSKRIFQEACKVLEQEDLPANWHGAISGLALLATGNGDYLPKVRELARKIAAAPTKSEPGGMGTWETGYRNIFLCEYFLLTGDKEVLPAIERYTLSLSKGQGMYGTFGHGYCEPAPDGGLHGSIPPYGPVNMAGLPANLSIVLGKKCGVKDPEVDQAIRRASQFFGYFAGKGAIPYGEHEPWPYHENNGKNSLTALLFAVQDNRVGEAKFFARMATAGFRSRECGHTGQGFSYLWSALGAGAGGPEAVAAFFREASWHLDLVRRCDGSFTYDGGEQYGPGKTSDNTYYGKSGYYGLSPTATYVLTYSLPLRKLLITGRDPNKAAWLSKAEAAGCVASGRFDLDRKQKSPRELVAAFDDWSPIVRSWAAEELAGRPEAKAMEAELIALAGGKDVPAAQGACEALGLLKCEAALPVLVRQLSHEDRWLRYKAAAAIRKMGAAAKPALPEILKAVVATAEPPQPINWSDPVQLVHGQLAAAVFADPLADALQAVEPKLFYQAVRVLARNADGMARMHLRNLFEKRLKLEDVLALGPDICEAAKVRCPADTMFGNEIRMGAFKVLAKYHFREGMEIGVIFAKTQGGHGSQKRTVEIMAELARYGKAARPIIPGLRELIAQFNTEVKEHRFPGGELNRQRVSAVEDAIKAIESATTEPELRSLAPTSGKAPMKP